MHVCDVLGPESVISHLGHMYVGAQTPHIILLLLLLVYSHARALSCTTGVSPA